MCISSATKELSATEELLAYVWAKQMDYLFEEKIGARASKDSDETSVEQSHPISGNYWLREPVEIERVKNRSSNALPNTVNQCIEDHPVNQCIEDHRSWNEISSQSVKANAIQNLETWAQARIDEIKRRELIFSPSPQTEAELRGLIRGYGQTYRTMATLDGDPSSFSKKEVLYALNVLQATYPKLAALQIRMNYRQACIKDKETSFYLPLPSVLAKLFVSKNCLKIAQGYNPLLYPIDGEPYWGVVTSSPATDIGEIAARGALMTLHYSGEKVGDVTIPSWEAFNPETVEILNFDTTFLGEVCGGYKIKDKN